MMILSGLIFLQISILSPHFLLPIPATSTATESIVGDEVGRENKCSIGLPYCPIASTSTTTSQPQQPSPSHPIKPIGKPTSTPSSPPATTTTTVTSTQTPTETPVGSQVAETEDEDPNPDGIHKSDPLYTTPGAVQLRCTDVGVNCTNCTWLDWLQIYNKSIDNDSPAVATFSNSSEAECFQSCDMTSCVSFTFNTANKTCHIYERVNFEDISNNDTDSSLFIRLAPKITFLDEWLLTLNKIPRGEPFSSETVSNFLNCTFACAASAKEICVFATLNKTSMMCSLYSKRASKIMATAANIISIQHTSLTQPGNVWRFGALGPIYQKEESPNAYTAESTETCLEDCYSDDSCQLATTTAVGGSTTVDCFLYDFYDDIWFEDDPPTKATNSYVKFVPKNNTLYRKYPHFHRVHESSQPIQMIQEITLDDCKELAPRSSNCYYFSFNSTSQTCQIYDDTAEAETMKSSTEFGQATFSKTITNDQLSYYNFEPYWASPISIYQDASAGSLRGNACLEKCNQEEISKCAAVAIQRPAGNCTFYGIPELNQTLFEHNRTEGEEGVKSVQVFLRLKDLSVIQSPKKYRCFENQSVTWSDLNHILQSGSIDGRWDELPEGNNAPLTPHGPGFEGQGNNSAASPSSQRRYPLPPKFLGRNDDDDDELSPRWERLSKETQDSISKFNRNLFGTIGGLAGYAGGFATGAATGENAQAAFGGGAVGAYIGNKIGEGFGQVVDKLIDWGDAAICWLDNLFTGGCTGKKKEEESCATTCLSRSIDRFFDLIRAVSCTCDNEPDIKIEGKSMELLQRLQDIHDRGCAGRRVRSSCGICCRAGYDPDTPFLFCSCPAGGGDPEWVPEEGRCEPQQGCTLTDDGDWFGESMPRIPVRDCTGIAYYGSVFSLTRKIPFYTAYHFSQRNMGNVLGKKRKEFRSYPCEERNIRSSQLTRRIINGAGYAIGHFGNHADLRFRIDAGYANAYFINVAPQDGYSNHPAWEAVENRLRDLFGESYSGGGVREGIIITGVCFSTTPGDSFPTCFWKLACTRNDRGVVTVAAFYHRNILSPKSDPNKQRDRRDEVYQIRDQSFVAGLLGIGNMDQVWDESGDFFTIGPGPPFTVMQCAGAQSINFPPVRPFPPVRADDDEDYELFNFWQEKIFGDGFADTVAQIMNDTDSETEQNESGTPPACGKKVVGYVTGWSDVKFTWNAASYLTHAIFAFIQMRADGTLVVGSADPDNSMDVSVDTQKSYLRLHEMKRAKERSRQRLRTMFTIFAVGGWANSQYFSGVAASPAMTQTFIRSAIEIIDYFDMDGIDIDWEYPVTGGAQVGVQADRENYLTFLRAIRSALNEHEREKGRYVPYTLTIAGAAGSWVLEDGFDLPAIAEIVDWINVMTYDYFGAWDSQWGAYTGPHAPLYFGAPQGYSGKTNVDYTLKYYSCRIQNPAKLVMGLGFYGRFWNHSGNPVGDDPLWRKATPNGQGKFDGGFEPWRNIAKLYLGPGLIYQKSWHEKTQTPYLEDSSGFLLGYEDPRSIAEKVKYAAAKNFGGVMMWAIDLDDDVNTMLRTASSELLCSASSDIPSDYKCPPIQEKRWWTVEDDEKKAGMCGKAAPLYNDYYPVCDPEDPGYACCSATGYCGSGEKFCECDGCVDYFNFPEKILDEPIKPSGPVRWHTMDKFEPGPQCGYEGHKLENGDYAICNPDDNNGYCCSNAGYCGKTDEFCNCEGCINFKEKPDYEYPEKTWIDSGEDAGKCGDNAPPVNGKKATCNPLSKDYYCCSASGYCGSGAEYCDCDGCVNYKN